MQTTTPERILYLFLLIVILLWGCNWVVLKIGLDYLTPLWFIALRLSVSAVVMFVILLVLGKLAFPKKEDWLVVLSVGFLQLGLFFTLINYGLLYVEPGRSAILAYSTPLWVTPVAVLFFGERFNLLKLIGLLLGVSGIFILFSPWGLDWSDKNQIIGNSLLLLAAMVWASVMLISRFSKWTSSAYVLCAWQMLIGAIPTTLLALLLEPWPTKAFHPNVIGILFYASILAGILAFSLIQKASKALPVTTVSLGLLGVPVVGLLASALWLGEELTPNKLLAMGLILFGLICVALSNKRRTQNKS